jgi:aspartate racemase
MKKVGIIGGIGPASTLDYYKGIINGYREIIGNNDYPKIIIDSVNMIEMLNLLTENKMAELVSFLLASIDNLAAAGADFAAIASNTPHIVFDEVQKKSALPLISIVEETCKYAMASGCKKVLILGTYFTMSNGLYTSAFESYGIEAQVPDPDGQQFVHGIIFPNLENGIILEEDKQKLLEFTHRLINEGNADALVLGCTELPLIIQQDDIETPILNTTQIHIDAIVKELLK